MTGRTVATGFVFTGMIAAVLSAQTADVALHVAAARTAAGGDFGPLFDRLCVPPASSAARTANTPAPSRPDGPPPRASWHADPVKVFDNLYLVGQTEYEDWDLMDRTGGSWRKPKRDIVAKDGYQVTLGDTTLTLHQTPGHTLGTFSTVIPLRDGTARHTAAYWDGTAFNWLANRAAYITPARPDTFWFDQYIGSARRFRRVAAEAGADVLLSNHSDFDGSKTKLPALTTRRQDSPHPYVIGPDAVARYLTVAEECALAGRARVP